MSSPRKSYEKEIRKQRSDVPDLILSYLDRIGREKTLGHEQEIRSSRGAQAADREMRNALWLYRERIASQSSPLPYKPARWLLRREAG